ncbi:class I SAM-dependent methyltransferase [Arcticibacter eurypsychrophilus]|uniref:class I SAM-dependent methyltransferase n=1 Tax=Arcticibacter eurypsychrophilus TaxID=1434752 RepID=UPI00084D4E16|nr:class I SAM-dependent methyltransferase [Arcticibacter eurypsychrophilus]
MNSKITSGETKLIFEAKILNKYYVSFYQCQDTGFIQTEEPYWLDDAYSSAITKLDLGLVYRNLEISKNINYLLSKYFDNTKIFLDYAGGYGLFTRIMRDKGYDFYHYDPYCQNLFAENFDLSTLGLPHSFELVTAFEVLEHMADPLKEVARIMQYSDSFLFSTELQPEVVFSKPEDWWYFSPETGQHVSFYNIKSLEYIAKKLGYNFYTDGTFLHLFTKRTFENSPFEQPKEPYYIKKIRRILEKYELRKVKPLETLLQKDWLYVKGLLSANKQE